MKANQDKSQHYPLDPGWDATHHVMFVFSIIISWQFPRLMLEPLRAQITKVTNMNMASAIIHQSEFLSFQESRLFANVENG